MSYLISFLFKNANQSLPTDAVRSTRDETTYLPKIRI
jgi:hypothetical protein